ncbi:MAG: F0F1 ATP synthase subunit B [Prolixibacteraceae bacterium]|jgi:F-type H+-transporting ATPase subunit b|nr:F0F1 ATP synthase subunit B [Prolixibacteraceae bacterium]
MFLIPHLGTIIWVSIIFAVVYFVLAKFAWKPLLSTIEDRESTIAESLKNADEVKIKLKNLELVQEKIIEIAKQDKERIVREGIDQRDKIISNANDMALQKTNKMIDDARKQIERERTAALAEMKSQIAALSIEIATKLVKGDMEDQQRHKKVVEQLIDEIELN